MKDTNSPELEILNKVSEAMNGFQKMLGDKADKADLTKISTQIEEMQEDVAVVKERGGHHGGGSSKSLGQMVVDAIQEKKILEKPLGKGEHRTFEINHTLKVSGTMTTGNVTPVGTNAIPFSLADVETGLTRIVRRQPYLIEISNVSSIRGMYAQWAEQANPDGAAGETAEGNTKNQIDFDWVEKSRKVEKITAFIKVSKEALDDLASLRNEIDTELRETVLLKTDVDLMSGDGTTPTLNGLLNQDTAYSAGVFAGTIIDANHADVLRTAIAQIVSANFRPNYIILHPNDVAKLDLAKGNDGHYTLPPFKTADGMSISSVRIIENTGQTEDKFTVGDFTKFNVRIREGFTIDIGLENDDFTKNLVTILGEIRLVAYIKSNHQAAFVSGDFSDAITALDSGSGA